MKLTRYISDWFGVPLGTDGDGHRTPGVEFGQRRCSRAFLPNGVAARSSELRFRRSRHAGFTLLELLIGLVCMAIVLAVISGVFYSALRLRNTTIDALDRTLPKEQALAILKRDLSNLLQPGGTFAGELQTTPTTNTSASLLLAGVGEAVSPELYTASGVMNDTAPWTDIQRVAYYLVTPTDAAAPGRDLVRFVTRNLLPVAEEEAVGQWLMGGVQSVLFTYFDGTYWNDTWDSTTADTSLPTAIKVEIELAPKDNESMHAALIEMTVPLMLGGITNQTAQASGGEE